MVETLTETAAPPAETGLFAPPVNTGEHFSRQHSGEGLMLEPVEYDTGTEPPVPELVAPEVPAEIPAPTPESATPQPDATPAETPEVSAEPQTDLLEDPQGGTWRYMGQTETGMHKIESQTENHTKFISAEQLDKLKLAGVPETPLSEASTENDEQSQVTDPEKLRLQQTIDELTAKVEQLEQQAPSTQETQSQPEAEPTQEQLEREQLRNQNIDPRVIIKLKENLDKRLQEIQGANESTRKVLAVREVTRHLLNNKFEVAENGDFTPEGMELLHAMTTMMELPDWALQKLGSEAGESSQVSLSEQEPWDKDLAEFIRKSNNENLNNAEPESAPQTPEEAKKRFSRKFQSVRQELARLGGKTKSVIAETTAPIIDSTKEALSTPLMMGQVLGEKAGAAAKEGLSTTLMMGQVLGEKAAGAGQTAAKKAGELAKETVVYPALTGQVVAEKIQEKMPGYKRRLLGRAAGYTAVFSIWLLGPSEVQDNPSIETTAPEEAVTAPAVTV